MSYILEALKKSDQERKRGDVPGLQTVHIPLAVESKSPRLLYALILLLLFVLAFVLGLLFSRSDEKPVAETGQYNESAKQAGIAVNAKPQHALSQQSPVIVAEQQLPEVNVQQQIKSESSAQPLAAVAEEEQGKVVHSQFHGSTDIPYLHELPEHIQQSVPHMGFAGHVFSSTPSSRSVIINGGVMSEGDTIISGLMLEEITASGVIFSHNGERFRVDILQDWSFD